MRELRSVLHKQLKLSVLLRKRQMRLTEIEHEVRAADALERNGSFHVRSPRQKPLPFLIFLKISTLPDLSEKIRL